MRGHIKEREVKRRTANTPKSFRLWVDLPLDPVTRKRRQKTRTVRGTRKEAEQELRALIREVERGAHVHSNGLTVSDLLNRWLQEYAGPNVAAKTYVRYEQIVRNSLIPALGERLLEKLTPSDVNAYYSKTVRIGHLSKRTIYHHHRVLKQALKWAVRLELTFRNPADSVDPPRPERAEFQTFDADQARTLDAIAKQAEYGNPILLALHTGMRQAEILGLRSADLDLDSERLSVRQTLQRVSGKIIVKSPKSQAGRRSITLSESVVGALRRERAHQSERQLRLGPGWDNERGLLFTSEAGSPLDDSVLRRAFRKLLNDGGLPRIRFHDLRHTHATLLLQAGVHPKIVSERLGHANIQITLDTYSHVLPDMQAQAAAAFDTILNGGNSSKMAIE